MHASGADALMEYAVFHVCKTPVSMSAKVPDTAGQVCYYSVGRYDANGDTESTLAHGEHTHRQLAAHKILKDQNRKLCFSLLI